MLINVLINDIKLILLKKKWRKKNCANGTKMFVPFNINSVSIGRGTYGGLIVQSDVKSQRLKVGNFCSIAQDVVFILGNEHNLNSLSTFPFKAKYLNDLSYDAVSKGDIFIESDVWIGRRATILSGLTIGQGAVIAACAVVTKSIPPYAIAAGVPARVIKYRFSQDVISFLLTLDYSQLTEEMIRDHIDDLYTPLDTLSLDQIRSLYSWFPKRKEPTQQK